MAVFLLQSSCLNPTVNCPLQACRGQFPVLLACVKGEILRQRRMRLRRRTLKDCSTPPWRGAILVPRERVELSPLSGQDPKSCVSANFTTAAFNEYPLLPHLKHKSEKKQRGYKTTL